MQGGLDFFHQASRAALLFFAAVGTLCAQLDFEQELLQLKPSPGEKRVTGYFRFTNTGDYPVNIVEVRTSCGCTTTRLEKMAYAPGETGEIETIFKLGSREGVHRKRVSVYTDDKQSPSYAMSLVVDIPRVLKIQPRMLFWKQGEDFSPKKQIIKILYPQPVVIEEARSLNPSFSVELKALEEGRKYELSGTPKADRREQRGTAQLVARLPDGQTKNFFSYLRLQ